MPKNKVNDLIPDQEMAFPHLVHSGTMTDRQAAETAALNPELFFPDTRVPFSIEKTSAA